MSHGPSEWNVYRTRFLIKARQLTQPLIFVDCLGREHRGGPGDYLVESSDGTQRIAAREIFEDIYVAMGERVPPVRSQAKLNRAQKDFVAANGLGLKGSRSTDGKENQPLVPLVRH